MVADLFLRVVIDTNVLFEGLTHKGGASGIVIEAWLSGLVRAYVSNALAYQYVDVLSRKLAPRRWQQIKPVLARLLEQAQYVPIYFSWRPSSPDPGDELLIDCAMNCGALLVTWNMRDFALARRTLGLRVMTPTEFLIHLSKESEI